MLDWTRTCTYIISTPNIQPPLKVLGTSLYNTIILYIILYLQQINTSKLLILQSFLGLQKKGKPRQSGRHTTKEKSTKGVSIIITYVILLYKCNVCEYMCNNNIIITHFLTDVSRCIYLYYCTNILTETQYWKVHHQALQIDIGSKYCHTSS